MALEKEIRELKLISDINKLSIDDLEKKYLKDEKTYKKFINDYTAAFKYRLNYQLRIADQYDKIYTLYRDGLEQYPSEDAIDKTAQMIDIMSYVKDKYSVTGTKSDDKDQSHALFREYVGANCTQNISPTYEAIVEGIYDSCFAYYNRGKFNISDYMDFITEMSQNQTKGVDLKRAVLDYRDEHPLCKMCNDPYYLYYVNYMLRQRSSLVDEEFIENAKGIMEMSKFTYMLDGERSNKERLDYKKLSRYTSKNIREYERKNKKEKQTAKKVLLKELSSNRK